MRKLFVWALAVTSLCGCSRDRTTVSAARADPVPLTSAPHAPADEARAVRIEMRNVRLHADDHIVLVIKRLRGEMISRVASEPPVFDDPRSYVLRVVDADISMDMASLSALMNTYVFAGDSAPVSGVTMKTDEKGRLEQKGTLHKGLPVPFRTTSTVSATPEGRMLMHTESVKTLGIPAKGLLRVFGLSLGNLVHIKRRGVDIAGNDILITPGLILPPPELRGHLANVTVVGNMLVQRFSSPEAAAWPVPTPPDGDAPNYVYFSGASIRFGKLTMSGSDLQLIDADPSDWFDFFPTQYQRQLVAGYSLNTPEGGLKTYMPDFDEARRGRTARPGGQ